MFDDRTGYDLGDPKGMGSQAFEPARPRFKMQEQIDEPRMREVTHLDTAAKLPPPMSVPLTGLPHMRREQMDSCARRIAHEATQLSTLDDCHAGWYRAVAKFMDHLVLMLDEIEDLEAKKTGRPVA